MAKIVILGTHCRAVLTEPDKDGEHGYVAACGGTEGDWGRQPMEDMVQAADNHVSSCRVPAPPANHPNYE
jgi:hypothetical protein